MTLRELRERTLVLPKAAETLADYSVDVVLNTIGLIAGLVGAGILFRYGMRAPQNRSSESGPPKRRL